MGAQPKVTFTARPENECRSQNAEGAEGSAGLLRGYARNDGEGGTLNAEQLPKGISRTVARLHFPEEAPYPYIDIPVTLLVPSEIAVLPPDIALPPNSSASAQRNVALRSPSRPFNILEVRCPVPSWTVERHSTDGKMWRLKFGDLQSTHLPEHSEIVIRTDHPECPEVVIPVHAGD